MNPRKVKILKEQKLCNKIRVAKRDCINIVGLNGPSIKKKTSDGYGLKDNAFLQLKSVVKRCECG